MNYEIGKTYYMKRLSIDGEVRPQETCKLLQIVDDELCVVKNEDGLKRLFRLDMLSEDPTEEIYLELKSEPKKSI